MPDHDPGHTEVASADPRDPQRAGPLRTLFVGLPAFEGSFAQDLLQEIMQVEQEIQIVAVTTPAPQVFARLPQFAHIEWIQKDDFEFRETIERLNERHGFRLSRARLERHAKSEYAYLSISDRRAMDALPVLKRRELFRQLLAYWYDFLSTRAIDAIVVVGYPHAGWNNVLVDVARALALRVVLVDFTVIQETTLVSEIDRMHEPVPPASYAGMTIEELRERVPGALREKVAAPLFGLDYSDRVKREAEREPGIAPYYSLLAGLLRKPWRRSRPSFTRLSGDVAQWSLTFKAFAAKRHVAALSASYRTAASQPDLTQPFIYFPLHMQPERSTMPAGGVFEDQILVAEILSAALPAGWRLYVKEHASQFWQKRAVKQAAFRDEAYYRRLRSLANTELIDTRSDSLELIRHASLVATVTGTAGWESLLAGKPCIVFGDPWYAGCSVCFAVGSVDECVSAIAQIRKVTPEDVERAVLEFLLHYSDRILPVPFLPDRHRTAAVDYQRSLSVTAEAVTRAIRQSAACDAT